jgi:flagellar motility protein MotE (MotC chaperone)
MDLKKVIEKPKKASNKELFDVLNFLNEQFQNNKAMVINITHQMDAIEKDYRKLYSEYENRLKGNG